MNSEEEASIRIQAGTTVSGGTINGNVSGGTVSMGPVSANASSASKDLLALLLQLKAEVATTEIPKQEATTEHLDGLIEQTRSAEPEPGVSRWCWAKITAALAGIKQFDDLVGQIAQQLAAVWPG